MKPIFRAVGLLLFSLVLGRAETNSFSIATLNCFWFYDGYTGKGKVELPREGPAHAKKAENLVSLLPATAPLLVAVQEIGAEKDAAELARFASQRYGHPYRVLFLPAKDAKPRETVAALLDTAQGWGVVGNPSRDPELEKLLPWHLSFRMTNFYARVDVCVVRLQPLRAANDVGFQIGQSRALASWARPVFKKDRMANVVILGDFNERRVPGSGTQGISDLIGNNPPITDPMGLRPDSSTHVAGVALDRILISQGLVQGASWYLFKDLEILKHEHTSAGEQKMFTSHFPVVATFVPRFADPSSPD